MSTVRAIQDLHRSKLRRYRKTIGFLAKTLSVPARILDLGTPNPLGDMLKAQGYTVINTTGDDLDVSVDSIRNIEADCTTAFEIFEHLLNPLGVLQAIPTQRLVASVPLSLWFAKAYRSRTDSWDRHFHEFEDWQFDWLLEKAGWKIIRREKWTSPVNKLGIRPLLRQVTPRYYVIEAIRSA